MKTKLRLPVSVILLCGLLLGLSGCQTAEKKESASAVKSTASSETTTDTLRIAVGSTPLSYCAVSLMNRAARGSVSDLQMTFSVSADESRIVNALRQGTLDAAVLSPGGAAELAAQSTNAVQVAGCLNQQLVLASSDETVLTVSDLKTKRIVLSGTDMVAQATLSSVLTGAGYKPGTDVLFETVAGEQAAAEQLEEKTAPVALLSLAQAQQLMKKDGEIHIVADVAALWTSQNKRAMLPGGLLVVRKDYAAAQPAAVALLQKELAKSVIAANEQPEETAGLCIRFGLAEKDTVAAALTDYHAVLLTGDEMKTELTAYLKVIFGLNHAALGGALPEDPFYLTTVQGGAA